MFMARQASRPNISPIDPHTPTLGLHNLPLQQLACWWRIRPSHRLGGSVVGEIRQGRAIPCR